MSECCWDACLTQELAEEICKRSAAGESVIEILREKGVDVGEGLDWMKENHSDAVRTAKVEQIRSRASG